MKQIILRVIHALGFLIDVLFDLKKRKHETDQFEEKEGKQNERREN